MALIMAVMMSFIGPEVAKEKVTVHFTVPVLDVSPYHRPYVAVWVETEQREGIKTLIVWHEGHDWLKDLRQWWRRLGRSAVPPIDGVSGATPKPGQYSVVWDGLNADGQPVEPGTYIINIEAARENGGRDFHRQKIVIGQNASQNYRYEGKVELKDVKITVHSGE